MRALARDLRQAVRSLSRRPALAFVAVTSIALGIAFNAVIFSAIDALLLERVPGVEADGTVEIGRTTGGEGFDTFGYVDFLALREGVTPLAEVAAWRARPLSWGTEEGGERVTGMTVSPGYFRALGVTAARGRLFGPDEERRGGPAVAVISHRFWQERLGGDPDVMGRTLELSRTPFTVIGVASPEFGGHIPMVSVDVWTPIARTELADPSFDTALYDRPDAVWLHLVGRLGDGATLDQAGTAASAVMARLAAEYPGQEDRGARVVPLGPVPGAGRAMVGGFLGVLMGLVGLVLLITASNVAGMLLARAADRQREIAIHLAIGAGRARLVRMLTAESVVLFLAGGAVGTALAFAAARLISGFALPTPEAIQLDINADGTVLVFAFVLAAITGVIFGLAPAIQASRPDLVSFLHSEGRGRRTGRLRRWLAAGQVAVAMVLLVAAGLFLRSLQSAGEVDAGFDPGMTTVASIDLALEGYDDASGPGMQERILERVRALPDVDHAALALDLPLDLGSNGNPSYPERRDGADPTPVGTEFNVVSTGYFETLDIPVHQGRVFRRTDRDGSPLVVVVNRAMAERAWPGEEAVGKRLRFRAPDAPARTVVGVVADVKNQTLGEVVDPMVYLPTTQRYVAGLNVLAAGPGAGPAALRRAILEADPRLSVGTPQELAELVGLGILPQRVAATLATALGGLALFLSVLGVYGVVAHSVAGRGRELGIRMAVGASRGGVVALVLRGGARMVLPGLVVGAIAALGLGQVVRSLLFGVSPADGTTLAAVVLVMAGAVLLATGIPALRAARQDPMEALRSE